MPQSVIRHEGEHLYADQPSSDEGRRLSDAILRLRRVERVETERSLRASGLSNLDMTALRYLVQASRDGKDLGPKDLITMLDTSSANVTNVIERLVGKGFVTRVQHPADRRSHHLVPAKEAIRLVDLSFGSHHGAIVAAIDELPAEDQECAARVVSRIADAVERIGSATDD